MVSINTRKFSSFETIWSKCLPIAFLFIQYSGVAKLSICYGLCLIYAVLCLFRYGKGKVFKPLLLYTIYFFGYALFVTFAYYGKPNTWLYVIIYRYSVSILCVLIISQHLDRDALYKTWKWIGLIVGIVIIFQAFQIYVLHQQISTIQLIPGQSGGQMSDVWGVSSRPVAFFTEPSMVIAFLLPLLFLAISKRDHKFAIYLSVCMLLTMSTSGLVVLFILWGIFIYHSNLSKSIKIRYFLIVLLCIVAFFTLPVFQNSVDKLNLELSGESSNAFGRVYSGWLLYAHLDFNSQLFGIPDTDYNGFIRDHAGIFADYVSQSRMEDGEAGFFFNTAQHIFLRSGIIGALLFIYMLFKIFKNTDRTIFPYFICVIALMFFELNFFYHNTFLIQYIVLLSYMKNQYRLNYNK